MSIYFNETLHSNKARINLYGGSSIMLKFEKIRKLQGGKVDQIPLEVKSAHQKTAYIIGIQIETSTKMYTPFLIGLN